MKDSALYLEVDEDITSAIDKMQKLPGDTAQIVVPKRSTMLQSIINLKLLKKAAADSGKELVLVTNDRIATDLAGRVGLAVAPSLGATASVPEAAMAAPAATEEVIEANDPEPPAAVDAADAKAAAEPAKPLFKRPSFAKRPVSDASPTPEPAAPAAAAETVAADAKSAGPKVPNFNQLQRRLVWAGGAVALVLGYFVVMYFVTSAKVTLFATGTKVSIDTTFAADPNLKQTDSEKGVLAAQAVTVSKDLSGSIRPTGTKDDGTKATGSITISNCLDTTDHTFVSGTRFQAPDGKIFRSTADVVVPGGQGSFFGCTKPGTATVAVQADQNGDSYNEAAGTYTIPGLPASQQAGANSITAKGNQMSGGTSKTVTVVTQADVDKAKADLLAKDKDDGQRTLDGRVPSGFQALSVSSKQTADGVTANPAVDSEATTATLTLKVTYTELAVKQSEYQALIQAREQTQIGAANQIYDDGLSSGQVTLTDQDATGRADFHFTTEASGGAKIDKTALAKQLVGKRYGDAADLAAKQPGVQQAQISLSPVWATGMPAQASRIKITIQVAGDASN